MNTQPIKHHASTAAGGHHPANNMSVVSQTPNMMANKQHNIMGSSYASQMQVINQSAPGVAPQQLQNQSQTAFFEKRNRSRGVPQQQLITNQSAVGSAIPTPSGTLMSSTGQQVSTANQTMIAGMMITQ